MAVSIDIYSVPCISVDRLALIDKQMVEKIYNGITPGGFGKLDQFLLIKPLDIIAIPMDASCVSPTGYLFQKMKKVLV